MPLTVQIGPISYSQTGDLYAMTCECNVSEGEDVVRTETLQHNTNRADGTVQQLKAAAQASLVAQALEVKARAQQVANITSQLASLQGDVNAELGA